MGTDCAFDLVSIEDICFKWDKFFSDMTLECPGNNLSSNLRKICKKIKEKRRTPIREDEKGLLAGHPVWTMYG